MFNFKKSVELFKVLYYGGEITDGAKTLKCDTSDGSVPKPEELYDYVDEYVYNIDDWEIKYGQGNE